MRFPKKEQPWYLDHQMACDGVQGVHPIKIGDLRVLLDSEVGADGRKASQAREVLKHGISLWQETVHMEVSTFLAVLGEKGRLP